jgi:8-oxo-dGTP pyrophosphatase MutT (NUDIX family)
VIVLRPGGRHPFDVLLVRRNDQVAFMAGAYVFPGGRVDDCDAAVPAAACDGLDTLGRCADLPAEDEARYRVAAIRELFEEAGVLLARGAHGVADAATAAALRGSAPAHGAFVPYLSAHGLRIALDAVMPFAHWVTPEIEIRRYDTRFLLARVPEAQDASHDAGETTALEWLTPGEAIARGSGGEIMLPPPTWTTLKRLAKFASIDEAWHWAATTPIVRVQPVFVREGETTTLMLPGDAAYPLPPGCEPFEDTRFELEPGRGWRPVRP